MCSHIYAWIFACSFVPFTVSHDLTTWLTDWPTNQYIKIDRQTFSPSLSCEGQKFWPLLSVSLSLPVSGWLVLPCLPYLPGVKTCFIIVYVITGSSKDHLSSKDLYSLAFVVKQAYLLSTLWQLHRNISLHSSALSLTLVSAFNMLTVTMLTCWWQ